MTSRRGGRRLAALGVLLVPAFAAALVAFAGCSSGNGTNAPPPLALRDDDASRPDAATELPDGALPQAPDAGGPRGTIYVQTGTELATFDPYSKKLSSIGAFDCLPVHDFMLDIAVDRDSNVYGTTSDDRFVKIDPVTARCTVVRQGSGLEYPILIAFVPRGTLDPANDALVGFDGDSYLRLDLSTGAVTKVGTLNPPDASSPYVAVGDLVSAGQNGMFLTATVPGAPADAGDSFVRFDPKTGRRLALVGGTGYDQLFGLGYWGGRIFGFTTRGEVLDLDPRTAAARLLQRYPANDAGDPVFYGAASTTIAPESPAP